MTIAPLVASAKVSGLEPCIWLNILGGVLEISGFTLVAVELFRTQRREFGTPKLLQLLATARERIRRFFRKLFGKTKVIEGGPANLTLHPSMGVGSGTVELGAGPTSLDDRVAALEQSVRNLRAEVEKNRADSAKEIERVRKEQEGELAELKSEFQEREEEEKAFLRTSLKLQRWGIGLFVSGTAASVVANVVSCG